MAKPDSHAPEGSRDDARIAVHNCPLSFRTVAPKTGRRWDTLRLMECDIARNALLRSTTAALTTMFATLA